MPGDLRIIIVAGPNGAGKTTFAGKYLNRAECPIFVNADEIASKLAPRASQSAAIRAGRLMLGEIGEHFKARRTFSFESTLSGRAYLFHIGRWQRAGYKVKCIYLWLPNADYSVMRVAERVKQGGHDIPEDVIRRRFDAGLKNFRELYAPLVDSWALYDNSGATPVMLEWGMK